jgi:hypothetical protein
VIRRKLARKRRREGVPLDQIAKEVRATLEEVQSWLEGDEDGRVERKFVNAHAGDAIGLANEPDQISADASPARRSDFYHLSGDRRTNPTNFSTSSFRAQKTRVFRLTVLWVDVMEYFEYIFA